jgi:hypothetical protein
VRGAVLVCALGTAYAEIGYLLEATLFWPTPPAAVDALRWVNANTPRTALVAIRPSDYENMYGYWLRRRLVVGGRRLAVLFGADPEYFDRTSASLEGIFAAESADAARAGFDSMDADVVMIKRENTDPAWLSSPCFRAGHRNDEWTVVLRDTDACARDHAASGRFD